jgi:hypothetical protein
VNFQSELQKSKRIVREWVRAYFSDEKLACVAAFNEDEKMSFRDSCGCLMGVTFSQRLHSRCHSAYKCDGEHYWQARKLDLSQTKPLARPFLSWRIGKTESAYIFLGFSPKFDNCFGHDDLRRRRLSALLRAEMRRRERTRCIEPAEVPVSRPTQVAPLLPIGPALSK